MWRAVVIFVEKGSWLYAIFRKRVVCGRGLRGINLSLSEGLGQ